MDTLLNKPWWNGVDDNIKELLSESFILLDAATTWKERDITFHDYSFVVFPAAKAYEGYLKLIFYRKGFITEEDYKGKRFRVGKALNPSLEKEYREQEGVYDKIANFCGSEELATQMWDAWKNCRNILFHYFPDERNYITLDEAKSRVTELIATIDATNTKCRLQN